MAPADVADLVQDVFAQVSRLQDVDSIEKPEHYIFRAAANTLNDYARREGSRGAGRHIEFDPDRHADSDFSPDRVMRGRNALAAMEAALRALPERTRTVFMLRVIEEQKTRDVARALGISTRAVEQHQARGLAAVAAAVRAHRKD